MPDKSHSKKKTKPPKPPQAKKKKGKAPNVGEEVSQVEISSSLVTDDVTEQLSIEDVEMEPSSIMNVPENSKREPAFSKKVAAEPPGSTSDGERISIAPIVKDYALLETEGTSDLNTLSERDEQLIMKICEAELGTHPDEVRAAWLNYEMGQECDVGQGDRSTGLAYYQKALELVPEHLPALRAIRRIHLEEKRYKEALPLFDAELRIVGDPEQKARLHYEKGRVHDDFLHQPKEARDCYGRAAKIYPGDPASIKAVEQVEYQAKAWPNLVRALEQEANAVSDDHNLRAALFVERARIHEIRQKKNEPAIELYEMALDFDPQTARAIDALKRLLHQQSRWLELVAVLTREAERFADPEIRSMALYQVGRIYSEHLGNREKAIDALAEANAIHGGNQLLYEELARLYELENNGVELVNTLKQLVSTLDRSAEKLGLQHRIGQIYEHQLKDLESAITWYESALAIDPTFIPVLRVLGKLYTEIERWTSLIEMHLAMAGATKDTLGRADAHARVAEIYETKLDMPKEAIHHHDIALGFDPKFETSFKALARLYNQTHKYQELIELYERAIDHVVDVDVAITYLFRVGDIYEHALRDPAHAIHCYTRILDRQSGHLGAVHALQRATEAAGRYQEFVDALEMEAKLASENTRIVALLHRAGEVLDDKLDKAEAALKHYRKVLEIDGRYTPALSRLGRLYHKLGRFEDLLRTYNQELKAIEDDQAKVGLLHKMGELCQQQLGDELQAVVYFRKAIDIDQTHGPALHALSRILYQNSDWKGLVEVLQTELHGLRDPLSKARVLCRLGEVYEMHMENPIQAASAYRDAVSQVSDSRTALEGLGRVNTILGEWNELAQQLAGEVEGTTEPDLAVSLRLRLGEILSEYLGQPKKAMVVYEQVLEKQPENLAALLSLESLYRKTRDWNKLASVYKALIGVVGDVSAKLSYLKELARLVEVKELEGQHHRLEIHNEILSLDPHDGTSLAALEQVAISTQNRDMLAEIDSRLVEISDTPDVAAAYHARLGYSLESDRPADALAAYKNALSQDSSNLSAIRGFWRLTKQAGDAKGMAEALRLKADWTRRNDVGADLLVQSAAIQLTRLEDRIKAVEEIELALERFPEHEDAAGQLVRLLLESGETDKLIKLLSRAAGEAKDNRRKSELWRSVALIYANEKKNLPAGISALLRVLKTEPDNLPILLQLAELYRRNAQWKETVDILNRVVKLGPDRDTSIDAHLSLARILFGKLGEHKDTGKNLQALLKLEADHVEALYMVVALRAAEGDTKAATKAARQLVDLGGETDDRVRALTQLGRLEIRNKQPKKAATAFREVIALRGPMSEISMEYMPLLGKQEPWKQYEQALCRYLEEVQSEKVEDDNLPIAFVELARVQHARLDQTDQAIDTLKEGLELFRGDVMLGFELGELLRSVGRFDEGIGVFGKLLGDDPVHGDAWRALARTLKNRGIDDAYKLALGPLVVLGEAESEEYRAVQGNRSRLRQAKKNAFGKRSMDTYICPPFKDEKRVAGMLTVLKDTLTKLYPPNYESYGVASREALLDGPPIKDHANSIARVFGIGAFDLFINRGKRTEVAVELAQPVALFVSTRVTEMTEAEQIFLLAKAFAGVTLGLHPLKKLGTRETGLVLGGAAYKVSKGSVGKQYGDEALKKMHKQLIKATPRRNRNDVEVAAASYAVKARVDLEKCMATLELATVRAAAILAGNLPQCVSLIRAGKRGLSSLKGEALVVQSPVIRDLMSFWVSEPALEIRRKAGIL